MQVHPFFFGGNKPQRRRVRKDGAKEYRIWKEESFSIFVLVLVALRLLRILLFHFNEFPKTEIHLVSSIISSKIKGADVMIPYTLNNNPYGSALKAEHPSETRSLPPQKNTSCSSSGLPPVLSAVEGPFFLFS